MPSEQSSEVKFEIGHVLFIDIALWKNADLDVPLLKQAKSEYAKLQ